MAAHPYTEKICAAALAAALVITLLFSAGEALGLQEASSVMGYETRLFDASRVHTIDIIMDDWEEFLETCENEEYQVCSLIIDGEAERNAAIRAKGNTSLTSVAAYGNNRYSFKVEFDHYDGASTYYGLDKLCLNNLIQDNTCMKDFLVYQLMGKFGAASPLCSYVSVSVNGELWGLYLAVEGVEDAFLRRNYGSGHGNLYKPDSMSFGGGRGNGGGFDFQALAEGAASPPAPESGGQREGRPEGGAFGGRGGMGSSDVKLQYIDDDPDSYANIFDSAKTDVTDAGQKRLIASLKALGGGGDMTGVVDVEQVIRYFVVHGFVCNGDSYTGSMVHNYYLYEEDGIMSMIPWDYNLAFGGFQSQDASGTVNEPIDTPVSGGNLSDRPMLAWIFSSEEYTQLYHQYYDAFISDYLESGACRELIETTAAMIAPYVENDPTSFCTYEEFETGAAVLNTFCELRAQSVRGQLDGSIPSTTQGQQEDGSALIDTSGLNLSDMGNMDAGGRVGGTFPGMEGARPENAGENGLPVFAPEMDSDAGDRQPQDGRGQAGGFSPQDMENWQSPLPDENGRDGLAALAASGAILAAGLIFAGLFRRRRA